MQPSEILARPIRLGPLTTKNRIVMPPLVIWQADESGTVTAEHLAHYARSGGPGLMIVEATTIATAGRLAATQLGIWSDDHVDGLSSLAEAIHATDALAGIQLHHAGGSTSMRKTYGLPPRVPTLLDTSPEGASELTTPEIDAIIEGFAAATTRALEAGFDVIELHGAHAYLISQFLSPETNRRADAWGGSAQKRRALMVAVIRAAREQIALAGRTESAALTIRLGIAASGPRALPVDEGLAAATAAVDAGVDFLDISNGGGVDEPLAEEIRRRTAPIVGDHAASESTPTLLLAALTKSVVGVPVVGVNGILTPEHAATAIEAGVADLTAIGRGILADPRWASKALGAAAEPIEVCRECQPRCFWFADPSKCPSRRQLAKRGEQPAVTLTAGPNGPR